MTMQNFVCPARNGQLCIKQKSKKSERPGTYCPSYTGTAS